MADWQLKKVYGNLRDYVKRAAAPILTPSKTTTPEDLPMSAVELPGKLKEREKKMKRQIGD